MRNRDCGRGQVTMSAGLRGRAFALTVAAVFLPLACAACSSSASSVTSTTAPSSSTTWPSDIVAQVKSACMEGGGTSSGCDCAVAYLENHSYQEASSTEQHQLLQDATDSCVNR